MFAMHGQQCGPCNASTSRIAVRASTSSISRSSTSTTAGRSARRRSVASALSLCAPRMLGSPRPPTLGSAIQLEITAVRRAVQSLEWLEPSITLGVNVSPETCCSPELSELLEIVPAHRLVLEITENAPVLDYERLANALGPLRARGVRLAIDDTCSGYASLRHVLHRRDTISSITLTRGVETDTARRLLVEALVGFAPSVGAEVLAEGIESADRSTSSMRASSWDRATSSGIPAHFRARERGPPGVTRARSWNRTRSQ